MLGQYQEALADFRSSLDIRPNDAIALFGRGVVRRKTGDVEGAKSDMEAAKSMRREIVDQFTRYWVKDL